MNPILYDSSTVEFNSNGIGILADAVSCYITSSFGSEELKMQYPVKGQFFSDIGMRSIILAKPERSANPQPYRIYKITKPMSGVVTIYARHLCYDLMGVALKPFSATSAVNAMLGLKENAATECNFDFWTDKSVASTFTVPVPTSIWQSLAGVEWSILATYGGEYAFDGNAVKLYTRRGADNGVSIRYGKNLTSLEQDENCANCYTGVMPYWQDSETGEVSALPEYVINAEGDFGYTKIFPLDLTGEFDTQPTPEQLRQRATRYMTDNRIGEPVVSWKVSFVQLEQSEEYRGQRFLEQVSLGDTVSVYFPAMGVKASARVVKAKFDCLLDRFDSVTLGSVKQSLASTIVEQKKAIDAKPSMSTLDAAVGAATSSILGAAGGAVRLLDTDGDGQLDTLYIADDPDPLKAQKVWRYNYEGWGASNNGYAGTYTMAATLNGGIVADMITSGVLNANLIQTGTIRSTDGRIIIDLDAGTVQIKQLNDQIKTLVESYDVEYYQSNSATTLSGGSWSSTAPGWVDGKYMWTRTKVTYADGTIKFNPSATGTCISGAKGATGSTGATGKGVASITEEYYLSTSKTTQSGGSWVTTPPTWSSGKYMWTRSKIVYNNPASTVYTTPVCDSSWEAANDAKDEAISSAENLIGDSESRTGALVQGVSDELSNLQEGLPAQIVNEMMKSDEWAALQQNITEIRTTASGMEIEISGTTMNLNNFLDSFHTYFKVAADGLHIAASGSEFETLLGNSKLSFIQAGTEVAYIQYNRLYITEAWVKEGLAIGDPTGGKYIRMYVDGNNVWCVQIMGG